MRSGVLEEIKNSMMQKALKLAVAESLTSGNIQKMIGSVSGASNFFEGGLTAYSLDQKVRHLGVDRSHAAEVDCVSEQVAAQMARGACNLFAADVGMATTGYAEPYPEQDVSSPFAYIAICVKTPNGFKTVYQEKVDGKGLNREEMQNFTAVTALHALQEYLVGETTGRKSSSD